MEEQDIILYTWDSKKKLRYVKLSINKIENGFVIRRSSGLLNGKDTPQPEITITSGKAKRTIYEQVELQYQSLITGFKDKGYKSLSELNVCSIHELLSLSPKDKEDSNGDLKPMLAKSSDKINEKLFDKEYYISRKIDGVRCMIGYKNNKFYSISRSGKNYDVACKNIFLSPTLKDFFDKYPTAYIDAELYNHGTPLEQISGSCRLETWDETRQGKLELWIFDIVNNYIFEDRIKVLTWLKSINNDNKIKIMDHYKVSGKNDIMRYHDQFINEGYEGAVIRDPNKSYQIGKRNDSMLKIKLFQDAEFKVIGITEGLRDEDMVFVCEMEDGKTFEAKPVGTREQRLEYLTNFEEKYKNKMATVKFFHYSEKGVPNLPIFKCFRID